MGKVICRKITLVLSILIISALAMSATCFADVDIVVGAYPASFLYSPDIDGFTAYDTTTGEGEEVDGEGSWIPNVRGGVGFDLSNLYLDLTAGVGYAYGGDVYTATWFLGDIATRFKVYGDGIKGVLMTLGPHAGVIYFDPEWKGDTDIKLEETVGYMFGACFTVGKKMVSFSASLDYVYLPVDVDAPAGTVTSDDEFDLSGIALQLGILFRF